MWDHGALSSVSHSFTFVSLKCIYFTSIRDAEPVGEANMKDDLFHPSIKNAVKYLNINI